MVISAVGNTLQLQQGTSWVAHYGHRLSELCTKQNHLSEAGTQVFNWGPTVFRQFLLPGPKFVATIQRLWQQCVAGGPASWAIKICWLNNDHNISRILSKGEYKASWWKATQFQRMVANVVHNTTCRNQKLLSMPTRQYGQEGQLYLLEHFIKLNEQAWPDLELWHHFVEDW